MRNDSQAGYALPTVLLGLIGLATLSTAGFVVARSDLQVTRNFESSVGAFYYADAGMSSYLAAGSTWKTGVTYAGDDGAATITSRPLLLLEDGSSLHHVTSTGSHAPSGDELARREVNAVVIHQLGKVKINSALTAVAGLHKNGVSGTVNGFDTSSQIDCPLGGMNNVAGLQVPTGGFHMNGGGPGGGVGDGAGGVYPGFFGDPAIEEEDAETLLTETEVDWAGWLAGTVVAHDYVVSEDGWPDFSELDDDEWPVIYVDEEEFEVTASMSGRGTIIAAGDLVMNGAVQWDGLVFVGDEFTSNGNQTVEGSVVTGLNLLLGEEVEASDLGNGTWTYQYHSCNVLWALRGMGAGVMEPGSWYETL